MKKYIKQISIVAILIIVLVAGYVLLPSNDVIAAKTVFNVKPFLTVGTTTPITSNGTFAHLKGGFSTTTTPILDSYASGTYGALDSATLLVQLTATSTPPTLKWRYEYSQDAVDWYSEDIELTTNASTTVHVRDFAEHSWVFTPSTAGPNSSTRSLKKIDVKTPLRYVRAVFYLPSDSSNAAVFTQWVSKNQI